MRIRRKLTLWLQASTANQEPINIRLLSEVLAVLRAHAATIKDPRLLRRLSTNITSQPLPNRLMHLLRLLNRGDLTRANRPDRLIRHHNLTPILNFIRDRLQLARNMLHGDALLALLERLAAAQDDTQSAIERSLGLRGDEAVIFVEEDAALAVAEDRPGDAAVFELVDADLAREGAVGLVEDVLGGHFKAFAEVLAGEEEVQRRWGDDDLCTTLVAALCVFMV